MAGKQVDKPYVAEIILHNESRRDIRSADFDQGKPLVLEFDAPVIAVSVGGNADIPLDVVVIQSTTVRIGPVLLAGGRKVRLTLVTDGEPRINWQTPLIGVKIESSTRENFSLLFAGLGIAAAGGALFSFGFVVDPSMDEPVPLNGTLHWLSIVGGILIFTVAFIVTTIGFNRACE